MIAFLDTRHPEHASGQFGRSPETLLDAGAGVGLGPQRLSDDSDDGGLGQAVPGHAGEGVMSQDNRFHDGIITVNGAVWL